MKRAIATIMTLSLNFLPFAYSEGAPLSDTSTVAAPIAVIGYNSLQHKAFTLTWDSSAKYNHRVSAENLAGYNIYRRASLHGTPTKMNSYISPIMVWADRIDGQTYYYSVRAVDINGKESKESWIVDSSPDNNIYYLSDDGLISVRIPGNIGKIFKAESNKYGVPLTLTTKNENGIPGTTVLRSSKVEFVRADTMAPVPDTAFPTADVEIKIKFSQIPSIAAPSASGTGRISSLSSNNITPENLSLYWNNGVSWIKLGGALNLPEQSLAVNSAQLGHYQLRATSPSTQLSLNKQNVYPRIFTPNGDGYNDKVFIVLENPNQINVSANIYDLRGRFISQLNSTSGMGTSTTLTWAGSDQDGIQVPTGEYLYQIEGESQVLKGVISLAR